MKKSEKKGTKPATGGKRVLIVEDDPINTQVLAFHLQGQGYEVHAVEDGEAAFVLMKTENFDIILLDLVMPGMTGFEVVRRVFADYAAPIIVITGHADEELRGIALGMGVFELLSKPYDFEILDSVMLRALS